jgi:hypothetical protein
MSKLERERSSGPRQTVNGSRSTVTDPNRGSAPSSGTTRGREGVRGPSPVRSR